MITSQRASELGKLSAQKRREKYGKKFNASMKAIMPKKRNKKGQFQK